jgi:hypothetical protein
MNLSDKAMLVIAIIMVILFLVSVAAPENEE